MKQLPLFPAAAPSVRQVAPTLKEELALFDGFDKETVLSELAIDVAGKSIITPIFANEFWTAKQRAAHSLHEISYRACFKPQLPRFFISRLTRDVDTVYDPFMGRGTTILEAALLGRRVIGNDINPLSSALVSPRLQPPRPAAVLERLKSIDLTSARDVPSELTVFYHPETLLNICALREYLIAKSELGTLDSVDKWIRMVAINRLTGHSPGFFSVYTMPPNQAVTTEVQKRINEKRNQVPPKRDVVNIIIRKTQSLQVDLLDTERHGLASDAHEAVFIERDAASTPEIAGGSVHLVVTSPPFLDVVNYAADNWLRCWFIGVDAHSVPISMLKRLDDWREKMRQVFYELFRVVRKGGHVAFEVGEIRGGKILLEETVIPIAVSAGFQSELVLLNSQVFTKTANTWGVSNNTKGTNTNRVVLLRRP